MGIDIGFVSDDLSRCSRAGCAKHRNTIVGFLEHAGGRPVSVQRLDTSAVEREANDQFRTTAELDPDHFALVARLQKVELSVPEGLPASFSSGLHGFRYEIVPQETIGQADFLARVAQATLQGKQDSLQVYSCWDEVLSWEARREICLKCPLRPLDEDSCYARFSNYPGMASFKVALSATIGTLDTIDRLMQESQAAQDPFAWWTFRGLLERTGHSSLVELHRRVEAYLAEETHAHMLSAEGFFDQVAEMVGSDSGDTDGAEVRAVPKLSELPRQSDVETLLAGLVYRDEPYGTQEMEFLLPRLYAYQAAAEWATWRTNGDVKTQGLFLGFLDRWHTLLGMLHTGWLMGLRMFVSY